MRAAAPSLGALLEVRAISIPAPGPGQVVVRLEKPGEVVGIVELLGHGVTIHHIGDLVALPWLGYACGSCCYCESGWETLCTSQRDVDGYAQYVTVDARFAVAFSD
jgi:propanol-preferring alcohol dehydrogenase